MHGGVRRVKMKAVLGMVLFVSLLAGTLGGMSVKEASNVPPQPMVEIDYSGTI